MATVKRLPKTQDVDHDYVRMYYEHQYERMAEQEQYRLTMTNYVLGVSALAFTFGYENTTQLSLFSGLALPLIIIIANIYAIATVHRTSQYMAAHQRRAHKILEQYAPVLKTLNDSVSWGKRGFLGGRKSSQISLHLLLIVAALIPVGAYIYQFR